MGRGWTIQLVSSHCPPPWLPRITLKQVWANCKNYLKELDWLSLSQIYSYILHFIPLSVNKISLHCHETNITRGYLASVIKSWENQLFDQCFNISDNYCQGASYKSVPRGKGDQVCRLRKSRIEKSGCRRKCFEFLVKKVQKFQSSWNVTTRRW